ncbi:unnamed protein product [Rotaria sp. Silwood2]|nr:unnamed protein product [Rotaria sp. Silwood2]
MADENSDRYNGLNTGASIPNNEITKEQRIIYYTVPANIQSITPQPYIYMQQLPNSQSTHQFSPTRLIIQQAPQQQSLSSNNVISTSTQQPTMHSNMNCQHAVLAACQPPININEQPAPVMINPTSSSTPVPSSTKRGRNDTSGISETYIQVRSQYPQMTHTSDTSNAPIKRHRGMNQPMIQLSNNQFEPSAAACRFTATRFPFSLFTVIFSQEVRDKIVIDDLTKHAKENRNFELKMIAYRRGRTEDNQHRILIFVENAESFVFLYNQENWSNVLAGLQYNTTRPSIPPQLALVIPAVSLLVDWEDFTQELKDTNPDIINVIRLKNKSQHPIRAVKLEFMSVKARNEILEAGEITVLHLKYKVVEFYAQANVLICSNCDGIGHFRKSCPQKNESTCKTCGERSTNLKDHNCSGIPKCIRCGEAHVSNDQKCKIVQQYRATLTRNLLANVITAAHQNIETEPPDNEYQQIPLTTTAGASYANVVKSMPYNTNSNEIISRKLDAILTKVEEESKATRQSLIDFKQEIRDRYDEVKQQVEVLEQNVITIEKKFEDLSERTCNLIKNICTALLDPQASQDKKWKSYWQEQIKALDDVRLSLSKSDQ